MDILEAIRQRRSVRSFSGEPLTEEMRKHLLDFVSSVGDPFGGRFTIRLQEFDLKGGFRPSTYGVIRGAGDYFLIAMADDEVSALAVGFCFEQVVLEAWRLGLGTCWIGGTFRSAGFASAGPWPEGQTLRIVCPTGVPARKSIMEQIMRLSMGSRNRKPFSKLFFTDGFRMPLFPDSRFGQSLEMLRLAPSSTNSQPWCASVEGDTVHFYYRPRGSFSLIDCGIALSHFAISETVIRTGEPVPSPSLVSLSVNFYKSPDAPPPPADYLYLLSYRST